MKIPEMLFTSKNNKDNLKYIDDIFSIFTNFCQEMTFYDDNDSEYTLRITRSLNTPTSFKLTLYSNECKKNVYELDFKSTADFECTVESPKFIISCKPQNSIHNNIMHSNIKLSISKNVGTDRENIHFLGNFFDFEEIFFKGNYIDEDRKIEIQVLNSEYHTEISNSIWIKSEAENIYANFFIDPFNQNEAILTDLHDMNLSNEENDAMDNNKKDALKDLVYSYIETYIPDILIQMYDEERLNIIDKYCNPHNLPFLFYGF